MESRGAHVDPGIAGSTKHRRLHAPAPAPAAPGPPAREGGHDAASAVVPISELVRMGSWGPMLTSQVLPRINEVVDWLADRMRGDYCMSTEWSPDFIAAMWQAGMLCIAIRSGGQFILLPKLHKRRSLVLLTVEGMPHIRRKVYKRARTSGLMISFDTAFEEVLAGCVRYHGENWLYPPMREAMRELHRRGVVHSCEVWNNAGELVAGELGYCVGSVYTSMTAFAKKRDAPSAGSVQLSALALLLRRLGYTVLDFGMHLHYKSSYGAVQVPRHEFLALLRQHREDTVPTLSTAAVQEVAARFASAAPRRPAAVAPAAPPGGRVPVAAFMRKDPTPLPQRDPDSKRQRKKRAKQQARREARAQRRAAREADRQQAQTQE
eukprot:TRINITY_DN2039_c0_g1_i1.p1 TRINITY_DN2039_c0_g1~~TRINITY_DN2039_c0_g1_i1.p1  ORF type:complete len:378 (+),score=76.10 TRINITY_DN2039_c0_g1_i1:83-1216(+)